MSEMYENGQVEEAVVNDTVETNNVIPTPVVKSGLATGALVLGILAIITTLFFINYIFGLIGLILGIVYLVKKGEKKAKGRAIAGIVCTVLSLGVSTWLWGSIYIYFTISIFSTLYNYINCFLFLWIWIYVFIRLFYF